MLLIIYSLMNCEPDAFFSKLRENKKTAELIKTANLLFNSFEPYYMWDYIARWFEECCRFVFQKCGSITTTSGYGPNTGKR